jgi:hypothetical protein
MKKTEKVNDTKKEENVKEEAVHIAPPNIQSGEIWIKGTSPLVIHKFADKAKRMIREKQAAGSVANSKKKREAKDFDAVFNGARHLSFEGWDGIPASAFRNACISACRLVGFKMVLAKLSLFIEADGFDATEGTPLVKIIGPEPRQLESMVRLATGVCDISVRPQWIKWGARLRVRFDADQFSADDIVNLVSRAGLQVGICEGRPGSTNSNGCGWGCFEVSTRDEVEKLMKGDEQ